MIIKKVVPDQHIYEGLGSKLETPSSYITSYTLPLQKKRGLQCLQKNVLSFPNSFFDDPVHIVHGQLPQNFKIP